MSGGLLRRYDIDGESKKVLTEKIREFLKREESISFAYLYGSFVKDGPFEDIDIALYIDETSFDGERSALKCELSTETSLEESLSEIGFRIPTDVRILNSAPLSFQYSVIRNGIPVTVRDICKKDDFELLTLVKYFDFSPFRREYLREVLKLGTQVR